MLNKTLYKGIKRNPLLTKKVLEMKKIELSEKLEPEALEYIQEVLQMLEEKGIIEDVDDAAIKMLAYNYSTFIKANKIIEDEGLTVTSDRGNVSEHPAVKIARDAQTLALKVMAEFGLTAKARCKLPKLNTTEVEDSPLEAFIKGRKQ